MSTDAEYYFNTETGEVEQGKPTAWTHRMGPYPTREEAARALEKAQSRNSAWEKQDAEDD
ncbi:SPOR domain-containing protein [Luteimicrobium subarcticum]|uniref:Sporulation related protein n=1 Tax=Luteimicrobium subarcticum TaxID=620910 RepID=A0A2M8WRA0_9MICO|nr:SPOR domain-containing protein [Luteimicrobium subarcticum]PJI93453.1 sporulation related protein [Luteimicrobium subarcticum]